MFGAFAIYRPSGWKHADDDDKNGVRGMRHCVVKTAIFTNTLRECHHKSSNNNLNIYETRSVDTFLDVEINFPIAWLIPRNCKWLREYAYHVTPARLALSGRKSISIKSCLNFYFKPNLCWNILLRFPLFPSTSSLCLKRFLCVCIRCLPQRL